MKNKLLGIILLSALIFFSGSIFTNKALAFEVGAEGSATREAIEKTEEGVLGSEKHAKLEKIEPSIDASLQKMIPLVIGGISLGLLIIAWYFSLSNNHSASNTHK